MRSGDRAERPSHPRTMTVTHIAKTVAVAFHQAQPALIHIAGLDTGARRCAILHFVASNGRRCEAQPAAGLIRPAH